MGKQGGVVSELLFNQKTKVVPSYCQAYGSAEVSFSNTQNHSQLQVICSVTEPALFILRGTNGKTISPQGSITHHNSEAVLAW